MAIIDLRLLPLIETLADSGADWLAFEILDGIRSGKLAEDSEDDVREAHRAVRSFRRYETSPPEMEVKETLSQPLAGDDQIDYAVAYVIDRISQAIEMAKASLQQLDQIASRSRVGVEPAEVGIALATDVHIRMEGTKFVSTQKQAEAALSILPELRKALLQWSQSVRQGEQQA